jgi:hypothetical protein
MYQDTKDRIELYLITSFCNAFIYNLKESGCGELMPIRFFEPIAEEIRNGVMIKY